MSGEREPFQRRVEELVSQFEAALEGTEWVTRRYPKRMRDDDRTVYEVPALYLQKGATKLLLDPIGYDVPGAEGAAEIYLMPAYDPSAKVYHEGGQWVIYYALPSDSIEAHSADEYQEIPLSAESINQVLDSIYEHAVPSI